MNEHWLEEDSSEISVVKLNHVLLFQAKHQQYHQWETHSKHTWNRIDLRLTNKLIRDYGNLHVQIIFLYFAFLSTMITDSNNRQKILVLFSCQSFKLSISETLQKSSQKILHLLHTKIFKIAFKYWPSKLKFRFRELKLRDTWTLYVQY